jgi:hypothetical protein
MGVSPSDVDTLRHRILEGEKRVAGLRARGLPHDRSEALLRRLRDHLSALEGHREGHQQGSDCPCGWYERATSREELEAEASKHGLNPCLFRVELPAIHDDQEFQGDIVYFALDEAWAHRAPPGAIVYTLAEIEALRDLQPAIWGLVHVAKRAGGVILEASGTLRRDLLRAATDLGARVAASEKGETR